MTSLKGPFSGRDSDSSLENKLSDGQPLKAETMDEAADLLRCLIASNMPEEYKEASNHLLDYIVETGNSSLDAARHDAMTGLYNQGYFLDTLEKEVNRCSHNGSTFSLVLFDLDNLKALNDSHGHAFGDKAIKKAAEVLRKETRLSDTCARYGGDEYAVILPSTSVEDAQYMCQRVRAYLNRIQFLHNGEEKRIGASFGIRSYDPSVSASELFRQADDALYHSKGEGKNVITVYSKEVELAKRRRQSEQGVGDSDERGLSDTDERDVEVLCRDYVRGEVTKVA